MYTCFLCIYVYICIYLCIFAYTCVYLCICIYVYMYICIYVSVRVPVDLPLFESFMGLVPLSWTCLDPWQAARRPSAATPAPALIPTPCRRNPRTGGGMMMLLIVVMLPLLERVPRMSGPSLGSGTSFSDSSAGSPGSSTWPVFWAARSDQFPRRPRHGDAHRVSSLRTMRCSRHWPAWTASKQRSSRMTTIGSATFCCGPLRAMTGSGPGAQGANLLPPRLSCATASNGTWQLRCKSGSSNPWRPPCPKLWPWLTSCSTRTPFGLCFRASHRPLCCNCSSGTMSTSYRADYMQEKQLRYRPETQDCLSEAFMIIRLTDCPGPKSGDTHCFWQRAATSTRPSDRVVMQLVKFTIAATAVFVDTRVGGSLGQGPPGVPKPVSCDSTKLTKLFGPFSFASL